MPYIDVGQKTNDIGHCRTCGGQWVVAEGTKGKRATRSNQHTGRVCPFCKSASVYYRKESNR